MARPASANQSKPPPPPDFEGAAVAVIDSDWVAEPPGPVQVSVNISDAVMITAKVPLVASLPDQPVAPPAMHEVAFWLLQVNCTVWPAVTDVVGAEKVTVGAVELTFTEYRPYPTGSGFATKVSTYCPGDTELGKVPPPKIFP